MQKPNFLLIVIIGLLLIGWSAGTSIAQSYTLTVTVAGSGQGTVTSSPAGIKCGSDCTETYAQGKKVTLKAKADAGSYFTGWSGGGCSGTKNCSLVVNSDANVTAFFESKQGPNQPDISVSPDSLDFGEVEVGKTVSKTLTISNIGTGDLHVTVMGLEGTDLSIKGKTDFIIKSNKNQALNVICKPTQKETGEELDITETLVRERAEEDLNSVATLAVPLGGAIQVTLVLKSNDPLHPLTGVPCTYEIAQPAAGCPSGSLNNYSLQGGIKMNATLGPGPNVAVKIDIIEDGTIDFTINKYQKEGYQPQYQVDCSGGSTDSSKWFCEGTTNTTATWTMNTPACSCSLTFGATNHWKLTGFLDESCSTIYLTLEATKIDSTGWSGQCCGQDPNQLPFPSVLPSQGMKRTPDIPFRPGGEIKSDCSSAPWTCTFLYTLFFK